MVEEIVRQIVGEHLRRDVAAQQLHDRDPSFHAFVEVVRHTLTAVADTARARGMDYRSTEQLLSGALEQLLAAQARHHLATHYRYPLDGPLSRTEPPGTSPAPPAQVPDATTWLS